MGRLDTISWHFAHNKPMENSCLNTMRGISAPRILPSEVLLTNERLPQRLNNFDLFQQIMTLNKLPKSTPRREAELAELS